jgi:hypothetical protein
MDIITRAEAKAQGLKTYFTGKPCRHGHVAQRTVAAHRCLACRRELVYSHYKDCAWAKVASEVCAKGLSFVYAYLRGKDSTTGREGSPYYIGVGSNASRPVMPHQVGCVDLVPVKPDQIVIMRAFLSRDQALAWEAHYIKRYGMEAEGGSLRNQTDKPSGIGRGYKWDQAVVARRAETRLMRVLAEYELSVEQWRALTLGQRNVVRKRFLQGLRGEQLLKNPPRRTNTPAQLEAAKRRRIDQAMRMGVDVAQYLALDAGGRSRVLMRFRAGWPSSRLLDPVGTTMAA